MAQSVRSIVSHHAVPNGLVAVFSLFLVGQFHHQLSVSEGKDSNDASANHHLAGFRGHFPGFMAIEEDSTPLGPFSFSVLKNDVGHDALLL